MTISRFTSLRRARLALVGIAFAAPAGIVAQQADIQQTGVSADRAFIQTSVQHDTIIRMVGVVSNIETKLPVRAQLSIDGDEITVRTNDKGRFYVRGVQPGRHVMQIRALGYDPRDIEVDVPESGSVAIDVQLAPWGYIGMLPAPLVKKPAPQVMLASSPVAYGPVLR